MSLIWSTYSFHFFQTFQYGCLELILWNGTNHSVAVVPYFPRKGRAEAHKEAENCEMETMHSDVEIRNSIRTRVE